MFFFKDSRLAFTLSNVDCRKKGMGEVKTELREGRSKRKKAEAKARKLEQQLRD